MFSKVEYVYLTDNSGSNNGSVQEIRQFLNMSPGARHFLFDRSLRPMGSVLEYGVNMSWTDFGALNQLLAQIIRDYDDTHVRFVFTSDGAHNATDMKSYYASLRGCLNNHKRALLARQAKNLRFDVVVVRSGNWFPQDFFRGFGFIVEHLLGGQMSIIDLNEAKTKKHFQLFKNVVYDEDTKNYPLRDLATLYCARDIHPSPHLIQQQMEALVDNLRDEISNKMDDVVSVFMNGSSSLSLCGFVEAMCKVIDNGQQCSDIIAATGTLRKAMQIMKGYRPSEQKETNLQVLRTQLQALLNDIRNFDMEIEFMRKTVVSLLTDVLTGGITSLAMYVTRVTCIREGKVVIMSMLNFLNLSSDEKALCLATLPHQVFDVPISPLLCVMYKKAPTMKNYRRILSQLILTLFTLVETGDISIQMLVQQLELIDCIIYSEPPYGEFDLERHAQAIVADKYVEPGQQQTFSLTDSHAMTLLTYILLKRQDVDYVAVGRMYLKFLTNPKLAGPYACHATEISITGIINLLDILDGEKKVWRPAVDHMQHYLQDFEHKRTSAAARRVTVEDAFFAITQLNSVHTFGNFLKKLINSALQSNVGRRSLFGITKTVGPRVVRAMLIHNGVLQSEAMELSNWMVGGTPQLIRYLCAMPTDDDGGLLRDALWNGFFDNEEEHPLTLAFSGNLQDAACYATRVLSETHRYKENMDDDFLQSFLYRDMKTLYRGRCVTCLLPLLNAPCMPNHGKRTHHHDKNSIPGIMQVYIGIAQMKTDVNIMHLLQAITPMYNEIKPFLQRFSNNAEKNEFLVAAEYYISSFRRLIKQKSQPGVNSISKSTIRRAGEKIVHTLTTDDIQVICHLLNMLPRPSIVVLIYEFLKN
jgi:hypothetical protein